MNPQTSPTPTGTAGESGKRDIDYDVADSILDYAFHETSDPGLAKTEAARFGVPPDHAIVVIVSLRCSNVRSTEHRVLVRYERDRWIGALGCLLDTASWSTGSHHDGLLVLVLECRSESEASGHARLFEALMKQMAHYGSVPV